MTTRNSSLVEDMAAGRALYTRIDPDLEVGHFAAMWHIIGLGHLIAMDLDRNVRHDGLSGADLHILGALRVAGPRSLRATDLAIKLDVSNAALSVRVAKLEKRGLVYRTKSSDDRRAFELRLTQEGEAHADTAILRISRNGQFVRGFRRLTAEQQSTIADLLGILHESLERDFLPNSR